MTDQQNLQQKYKVEGKTHSLVCFAIKNLK